MGRGESDTLVAASPRHQRCTPSAVDDTAQRNSRVRFAAQTDRTFMEQLKSSGLLPESGFPIHSASATAKLASRLYRARAYGLDLWSDIPLPEFMTAGTGLDVVIRLQPEDGAVACTSVTWDFR